MAWQVVVGRAACHGVAAVVDTAVRSQLTAGESECPVAIAISSSRDGHRPRPRLRFICDIYATFEIGAVKSG